MRDEAYSAGSSDGRFDAAVQSPGQQKTGVEKDIELQVVTPRGQRPSNFNAPNSHEEKWQISMGKGSFSKRWYMTSCCSSSCCLPCNFLWHPCRKAVSKKKKRYEKNGYDLDLVYLTDRIIVMGFPAVGLEHFYRNPRSEVKRFLDSNHGESYKVYNFCCEAGRGYPSSVFHGRAERYPFMDHGCPYLQTMTNFCDSAAAWLDADPKNVVALHCKAGKGRAGLMACCLLQRMSYQATAAEAIAYYDKTRTKNGKGLTVPTQLTSVGYYERCWKMQQQGKALPVPPRLVLVEVEMLQPPASETRIFFRLSLGAGATKHLAYESAIDTSKFFCNIAVEDVVQMEFFKTKGSKRKKLCICNFNTLFLDLPTGGSGTVTIPKDKLCKDRKHKKVPEGFALQLHFRPAPGAGAGAGGASEPASTSLAQSQVVPASAGEIEI